MTDAEQAELVARKVRATTRHLLDGYFRVNQDGNGYTTPQGKGAHQVFDHLTAHELTDDNIAHQADVVLETSDLITPKLRALVRKYLSSHEFERVVRDILQQKVQTELDRVIKQPETQQWIEDMVEQRVKRAVRNAKIRL